MKLTVEEETMKSLLEAVLLSSEDPVSNREIKKFFQDRDHNGSIKNVLESIQQSWDGKMVELVQVASGWRFQVKTEAQEAVNQLRPTKPPSYSRAVMETLAIIAYKQPVTRGDIEDIRSVSVSANIIRLLEARGWVETIGFRETPGRPALLATTKSFLDDLGLKGLGELPPLEDVGELIERLPEQPTDEEILTIQKELDIKPLAN